MGQSITSKYVLLSGGIFREVNPLFSKPESAFRKQSTATVMLMAHVAQESGMNGVQSTIDPR